jgi:hypothetical protein
MNLKQWKDFIGEVGRAYDAVRKGLRVSEMGHITKTWKIDRWASEEDREKKVLYHPNYALEIFGRPQFSMIQGNVLLNEGINALFEKICSSSGTLWDNTNAQLGTGTSSTGEAATDTDLLAGGVWKGMMATFPTYGTSQKATWKSEFLSAEANQSWQEFSVRNGSGANKNLNRKTSNQGTKSSGQVWELTLDITLS